MKEEGKSKKRETRQTNLGLVEIFVHNILNRPRENLLNQPFPFNALLLLLLLLLIHHHHLIYPLHCLIKLSHKKMSSIVFIHILIYIRERGR